MNGFQCPVCGYDGLEEPPRSSSGGASFEICDSCNFEFGYDDDDQGFTYEAWRTRWIAAGMPWGAEGEKPPSDWDPKAQLASLKSI